MGPLHTKLLDSGLEATLAEFVCALVNLAEFPGRLQPPVVTFRAAGVELRWDNSPNTLRLLVCRPGKYHFVAEIAGERALAGTVYRRELVQQFRNLLFWLWKEPW